MQTIQQSFSIITSVLKKYFNLPNDEILLKISNDSIIGYIISGKFHTLTEEQRTTLFQNILRNYSNESKFFGGIILLSLDEKDHIDRDF